MVANAVKSSAGRPFMYSSRVIGKQFIPIDKSQQQQLLTCREFTCGDKAPYTEVNVYKGVKVETLFERRRRRLLQLVQTNYDGNQTRLAEAIGRSSAYVSFVLAEPELPHHKNLGEKLARHIEEAARLPIGWLDERQDNTAPNVPVGGSVPAGRKVEAFSEREGLPEGYALIPRRSIKIAAGTGTLAFEAEEAPPLVFRQDWLDKEKLSPERLAVAYATGDSMTPRIHDGDTMLIDTTLQYLMDGKIYAVRIGDELRVKRIYRRIDTIILHSDNPAYPAEELSADKADLLHVIGRVVWISGTI